MLTLIGLIIICSIIVTVATVISICLYSGFNIFNIPGVVYGAYRGVVKSVLNLTAVIVLWLGSVSILKAICWAVFGYSLAVISPPVEMFITLPLGEWLSSYGFSVTWAMTIAYAIVAVVAGVYIIIFWFFVKDRIP